MPGSWTAHGNRGRRPWPPENPIILGAGPGRIRPPLHRDENTVWGGSPTYFSGLTEESLSLFARHLDSPFSFNVGQMSRYSEDWYAILSSLRICNLHFINRFYRYEIYNELFNAITGFETAQNHLGGCARDAWDLLKRLNREEEFGPADDRPPEMWFTPMKGPQGEPLVMKDYFGKKELDREDIGQFVRDYCDERGWETN